MKMLILSFVVVAVLALVALWVMNAKKKDVVQWPVEGKKPLSDTEMKLYFLLVEALPSYIVLAQVSLSAMIAVKNKNKNQGCFNKINQKSVDYVICSKDFSVITAIELDDSTHNRTDRKKADADKNAALEAAGIKLIRWKAIPSVEVIRQTFKN